MPNHRPRNPISTDNLILKAVLEAIERSKLDDAWITKRAGVSKNLISRWRNEGVESQVRLVSYVVEAIGHHVVVMSDAEYRQYLEFQKKPYHQKVTTMNIALKHTVERNFHSDPGHGWLEVTAEDLDEVGLKPSDFSKYSYKRGASYFLEEDVDASKFVDAYNQMFPDRRLVFKDRFSERESFVRTLERIHYINRM